MQDYRKILLLKRWVLNLSLMDLSKEINVSPGAIRLFETTSNKVTVDTLVKISQFYGYDVILIHKNTDEIINVSDFEISKK